MLKKNKTFQETKVHQVKFFCDNDSDALISKVNKWLSNYANKIDNPEIHFQVVYNGSNTWKYALVQYIQK